MMDVQFRPANSDDTQGAAILMAATMREFGVMTLGLGKLELELKALSAWFGQPGNRFSYEFSTLATVNGKVVALLLTLRGDRLTKLETAIAHGIFKIYTPLQLARMVWRLMVLGHTDEAENDEYLIAHLAVAEEFRRQGIATQLLERAEQEARQAGFSRLVLEVEINNTSARLAYEKFGFKIIGKTEYKKREKILGCPGFYKMLKLL
jgi:ribosomal protein S18 acetylase RimI-like enzyme